jgi:HK97 family phage prohead protease
MAANEPYGAVTYADPGYQSDGVKRYPIDTEAHTRAALAYFSTPANQKFYTASQVATIMRRIKAACKRFGIEVADGNGRSTGVSDVEYRITPSTVECRGSAGQLRIGGYAATFNSPSRLLGNFIETIEPTFFDEARQQGFRDVVARAEHDSRMLLGAVHSGTLRLTTDYRGLDYECDLPSSRRDVHESLGRGDYAGSSFAFVCSDDSWDYRDGTPLRILRSGSLKDVGPVTVPAYPSTTTALRSLARHVDAPYETVEMYSNSGELRRFFTRSDRPSPRRRTAAQAKVYINGRRWGYLPGPARSGSPRTMNWRQAKMRVLAMRPYDPIVVPSADHHVRHRNRQRLLNLRLKRILGGW